MAVESYATQLERVQAAIARIEAGAQTVETDGERVDRGDLATLYGRERELRRLVASEARGGGRRVRQVAP